MKAVAYLNGMEDELLEYLYDLHSTDFIIVNDFLLTLFPNPKESDYKYIVRAIDHLHKKHLIRTPHNDRDVIYASLGKNITVPGKMDGTTESFTLSLYKERESLAIHLNITIDGKRQVEERRRNKRQDELSEITKRTSFVQRRALKITVGIGILTLIVTVVNIWLTLRYQSKQLNIQERQQHLTPPPIHIDSVIVHHSRTDTIG
jgi:hypothetical protein